MKPTYWKIAFIVLALVTIAAVLSPTWQGDWPESAPILKTQLFRL